MTFNFVLFAIFFTINCSTAEIDHLRDIINEITHRYFRVFSCIAYVTDNIGSIEPKPFNSTTIVVAWTPNASVRDLTNAYESNCNGFVVRVSRQSRLAVVADLVLSYKKSLYSRYNNKRYLFLPVEEDDDDEDVVFLNTEYMYYMPNCVFVAVYKESFRVMGHNYFDGHKYDVLGVKSEVVDVWRPGTGFEYDVDLYPDKIRNLNGKLITLSAMNYEPYAIVKNVSDGETIFDGVETRAVVQFVEFCNGTWKGIDNPIHQWGEFFDNGSGNGIVGTVEDHTADMGYAAMYQVYCVELDCSRPLISSHVTLLVPKPGIISGWLTILLPFKPALWYAVLFLYVVSGLYTLFLGSIRQKMTGIPTIGLLEAFYDTYRLQIAQVPPSLTRKTALSGFYKLWGIYAFVVTVLWQCGISSFLTIPTYEKPIRNAEDLVKRYPKIHWGATHRVWVESFQDADDPSLRKIAKEFVVLDTTSLRSHVPKKDFAHFTEKVENGYYALNTYIDSNAMQYLSVMEKNLYGGPIIIMMTRGSPYQERLDEILTRMIDTGLIIKIGDQIALEFLDKQLQHMVQTSTENPVRKPTILSVSHIQGALYIFAIGTTLSLIVFVAEKMYFRTRTRNEDRIFFRRNRAPS